MGCEGSGALALVSHCCAIEPALRHDNSSPDGFCSQKENIMRSDRFIGFLLTMLASCVIQLALVPRASGQDGVEVPVSLDLYYCDIDQITVEPGQWEPTARDFYFDLFLSQSNVGGDGSFLIYTTDESDPREVTYRIKLLNEGVVIGDMPLHPEEMEYVSNPVVSSDGNSIAYWAKDLSGEVDIYVRKRTADSLEFSNPHGIGTTIPGEICGVSNDGNFVLLTNRLIGKRFVSVLSEFWNGPTRVTELFSSPEEDLSWNGTKISGDGSWIYIWRSGDRKREGYFHILRAVRGQRLCSIFWMMAKGWGSRHGIVMPHISCVPRRSGSESGKPSRECGNLCLLE